MPAQGEVDRANGGAQDERTGLELGTSCTTETADWGHQFHRGQTSQAVSGLFCEILFAMKWKHEQGYIE